MVDLIIIGAGPAGLTAAIYAAKAGLDTLIFDASEQEGLSSQKDLIENYPGFPNGISSTELMHNFLEQANKFGAKLRKEKVLKLFSSEDLKQIETEKGSYEAKAIIIATGCKYRRLGIKGEELLYNKGVFNCATSDGVLFKDKKVVVVGGGEAALLEALKFSQYAKEVVVVHRSNRLRAFNNLVEKAKAEPKIRFIWNAIIESIEGEMAVTGVTIKDLKTHEENLESAAGVFICIGKQPNSKFLGNEIPVNEKGFILTNSWMATEIPGIYAAGDVRKKAVRQISTAVGDGTEGAIAAQHYINNL